MLIGTYFCNGLLSYIKAFGQNVVTDSTMTLANDSLLLFENNCDIWNFNMPIGSLT